MGVSSVSGLCTKQWRVASGEKGRNSPSWREESGRGLWAVRRVPWGRGRELKVEGRDLAAYGSDRGRRGRRGRALAGAEHGKW